jgi:hypothetical protein
MTERLTHIQRGDATTGLVPVGAMTERLSKRRLASYLALQSSPHRRKAGGGGHRAGSALANQSYPHRHKAGGGGHRAGSALANQSYPHRRKAGGGHLRSHAFGPRLTYQKLRSSGSQTLNFGTLNFEP